MVNVSVLGAALLVVLLVCGIAVVARRSKGSAGVTNSTVERLGMTALRGARRRAVMAVSAAAAVLFVMVTLGVSVAPMLGVPVLLAAPVSAVVGLLLYSSTPAARHDVAPTEVRSASLVPRKVTSYLSGRLSHPPLAALGVVVVFVLVAGLTATTDDLGLSRAIAFSSSVSTSAASPYAGWFYGLPLLGACAALVAVTLLTMRRISAVPAFPDPTLASLDAAWRRESMRVVSTITVFALALPFGGAAAMSGRALLSAALPTSHPAWTALGFTFVITGLASLVLSGVYFLLATHHALALPAASIRAAQQTK